MTTILTDGKVLYGDMRSSVHLGAAMTWKDNTKKLFDLRRNKLQIKIEEGTLKILAAGFAGRSVNRPKLVKLLGLVEAGTSIDPIMKSIEVNCTGYTNFSLMFVCEDNFIVVYKGSWTAADTYTVDKKVVKLQEGLFYGVGSGSGLGEGVGRVKPKTTLRDAFQLSTYMDNASSSSYHRLDLYEEGSRITAHHPEPEQVATLVRRVMRSMSNIKDLPPKIDHSYNPVDETLHF